jgi:sugar phosphate permease
MNDLRDKVRPIFYGWWIVLAAILIQTLQAGLVFQGYGVYAAVLQDEFAWSKTLLASGFALMQAINGMGAPLQGWLLERYGARAILRFGIITLAVGFVMFSRITDLNGFFIAVALLAVGWSMGGFLSLTTAIVNWFERYRTTALALMQLGVGAGGLVVPLVALAINTYGWRSTAVASGMIMLLVALPLTQVVRRSPEAYGLEPDGRPSASKTQEGQDTPVSTAVGRDFTLAEALGTRAFWFLGFGHALALMVVNAVTAHAVLHLSEGLGYTLQAAASIIALMTACTMAGQLIGGILGDRINKRILATVAMLLHAAALFSLAVATSLPMVLFFAVGHGVAWGIRGPLMQSIRADYFGRRAFATIMGFSFLIAMLGTISGPLVAGILADHYGTYRPGFSILAGLAACGSVFFVLATKPAAKHAKA